MKQKLTSLALAAVLLLNFLCFGLIPCQAATDAVDQFALDFLQAVQSQRSSTTITIPRTDVQAAFDQMVSRYPILFHYYESMSWVSYSNYAEVTMKLKNLRDPIDSIPVITSEEQMLALFGNALSQLQQEFRFVTAQGFAPTSEMIARIADTLRHKYPLSYMGYNGWGSTYYTHEATGVLDYVINFNFFYDLDTNTLRQWRTATEQETLRLASTLFAQDMPQAEKLLRIHDHLVNVNRYNTANMDEAGNHLAYGALVKGSCVCQGYAEACLVLCQAAGIEAVYVPGDGINSSGQLESHGWNAVKIDGNWYMIDITWDDPVGGEDILQYTYFLVTNSFLQADHRWVQNDYPICNSTLLNADIVKNRSAQDTTVYTQYDNSLVVTQSEAEAEFQAVLQTCKPVLPQIAQPNPTIPPATQPEATVPAGNDIVPQIPQPTDPQITFPTVPQTVTPAPQTPSQEPDPGPIGAVVLVLLGGAALVFWFIRKQPKPKRNNNVHRREPIRSFDDLGKPPRR